MIPSKVLHPFDEVTCTLKPAMQRWGPYTDRTDDIQVDANCSVAPKRSCRYFKDVIVPAAAMVEAAIVADQLRKAVAERQKCSSKGNRHVAELAMREVTAPLKERSNTEAYK